MKTISIFNRALCLIVMALCSVMASGQNSDLPTPPQPGIPKLHDDYSPQVSMMQRYGTYPVDLSTGLVDISIPLYTIQTSQLTLPLGISFHPSGLKANEREGLLGIRWTLTGGGAVTRSIRGYSDFDYRSFNSNITNPEYTPDFHDLYGTQGSNDIYDGESNSCFTNGFYLNADQYIASGQYRDTEYDIFSYTLPNGKSGKFLLNTSGPNNVFTGVFTMPYEPIKINYEKGSHSVSITDIDGTIYRFGDGVFFDKNSDDVITTWHLTSITSADGNDVISFQYIRTGQVINGSEKYLRISDKPSGYVSLPNANATLENCNLGDYFLGELLCEKYAETKDVASNYLQHLPYSIDYINVTSGGQTVCEVEFTYEHEGSPSSNAGYLNRIQVKNSLGNDVKDIRFTMKKNVHEVGFLDKITCVDSTTEEPVESHSFEYYNQTSMMGNEELRKNSDWWGYYSAGGGWLKNVTVGADTPHGIRNIQLGSGDKQARPSSSMNGMIKSITYPTGGKTTFEYEGNTYDYNVNPVGGLRIKRIVNEAVSGKQEIKSYEYGRGWIPKHLKAPTEGYIKDEHFMIGYFHYTLNEYNASLIEYRDRVYQSFFPANYMEFNSNLVTYQTVTEYEKDNNGNTLGKTVYTYDIPYRIGNTFNEHYITTSGNEFCTEGGYQILHVSPEDFWEKPVLRSKSYYKGESKVKELLYEYEKFDKGEVYDLPVYQYRQFYIWDMDSNGNDNSDKIELAWIYEDLENVFAFAHQKYTSGAQRLTKETEITYQDNGNSQRIEKHYTYDNVYLIQQSSTVIDSGNRELYTTYAYPFSSGYYEEVYEEMLSRNMLTAILRKSILTEGESYNEETRYEMFNNNCYPYRFICSDYGMDITYHQYSTNGKPVYVTRNDGNKGTVYIWSYSGQYPIAEINNATYEEVCEAIGRENFISELSYKMVPSDTDYVLIRNLRQTLPEAHIITAKYKPLVGMTEYTDEKGMTTYYDYDGTGRQVRSYLKEGNSEYTLERNEYNYINR